MGATGAASVHPARTTASALCSLNVCLCAVDLCMAASPPATAATAASAAAAHAEASASTTPKWRPAAESHVPLPLVSCRGARDRPDCAPASVSCTGQGHRLAAEPAAHSSVRVRRPGGRLPRSPSRLSRAPRPARLVSHAASASPVLVAWPALRSPRHREEAGASLN